MEQAAASVVFFSFRKDKAIVVRAYEKKQLVKRKQAEIATIVDYFANIKKIPIKSYLPQIIEKIIFFKAYVNIWNFICFVN